MYCPVMVKCGGINENNLAGSPTAPANPQGPTSRNSAMIRTHGGSLTTQHLLFKGQLDNTEEKLAHDDKRQLFNEL